MCYNKVGDTMNENIVKLNSFFNFDISVKKDMLDLCPDDRYTDSDSLIKYSDKAYKILRTMFNEIKFNINTFYGRNSGLINVTEELEKKIYDLLFSNVTNINRLKKIYNSLITNMRPEFVENIKRCCIAYSVNYNPMKPTTINELLHLMHSSILNNNRLIENINVVCSKQNKEGYPISLRGLHNTLTEKIYRLFPLDLSCGWTEIVGVNDNKALMMIRDRGHATTIEITLKDNIVRMEYFIPKIINVDMINKLPGINKKYTDNDFGANGVFEANINNFNLFLYDFINRIPTDSDYVRRR